MVSQLWVMGRAETCPAYLRITQDIPTSFTGTHSENINTEPRDGSKERHCLYHAGYPMPLPRGLMKIRREASSYCLTRWWMKLQLWILHTSEHSKLKLAELWEANQPRIWASYIYRLCYTAGSCNSDRLRCLSSLTKIFRSMIFYCRDHPKCTYRETKG